MNVALWASYTSSWLRSHIGSRLNIKSERGATAVEYGVMVALIAALIVLVVAFLGTQVKEGFCQVVDGLTEGGIKGTGTDDC